MNNEVHSLAFDLDQILNSLLFEITNVWSLMLEKYGFVPGLVAAISLLILMNIENIKIKFYLIFIFLLTIFSQPALLIDSYYLFFRAYGLSLSEIRYFYSWMYYFPISLIVLFFTFQILSFLKEKLRLIFRIGSPNTRRSVLEQSSIAAFLPSANSKYDLRKYVNLRKGVFVGKNEKNKSVFISLKKAISKHWQVCGTTGAGKTVFLQMMIYQLIKHGVAVIVIDPKVDEHLPYIMDEVSKVEGVELIVINLLGSKPQWNPFYGKSARQIADLIIVGGKLEDKGGDGDFYAIYCRKMAKRFGRFLEGKTANLRSSITDFVSMEAEGNKEAAKFFEVLDILAKSSVTNIGKGLDIEQAIKAGNPIYFQGSMREEEAMLLQRMAVTSFMQVCESRTPNHKERHVSLFLDEFKVLINKANLDSLTGIRSRGANVFLAHQTQGDLKQITSELSEAAVVDNVLENTGFKVVHKVVDIDTATAFASRTGIELVDLESIQLEENSFLYERTTGVRTLRQAESFRVEPSVFQNLPQNCAVLLGFDDSKFIFTSYVPIRDHNRIIEPTDFCGRSNSISEDSNNNLVISLAEGLVNVD